MKLVDTAAAFTSVTLQGSWHAARHSTQELERSAVSLDTIAGRLLADAKVGDLRRRHGTWVVERAEN